MYYEVATQSLLGNREEQQDCLFAWHEGGRAFAVVCDGMGGLGGGSLASRTAVAALKELYLAKAQTETYPAFFLRAVDILDEQVAGLTNALGEKLNAGTTLVAAALEDDQLHWLSVGDSRLYILRGDEIVRATRDHNYFLSLRAMRREAKINTVQLQKESKRGEALISFIGMGGVQVMDINDAPFVLLPGDILLLCSDGLTKALTDEEIQAALRAGPVGRALPAMLESAAFQDNTTCVVIQFMGGAA